MTVAIGLVCSDGVVVASDSMGSMGNTARPICKVFAEPDLHMVWTAAGSVYVIEEVEQAIKDAAKDGAIKPSFNVPYLNGIRTRLGPKVTDTIKRCYGNALPHGPNQLGPQGKHPFISDFLLAGWKKNKAWFLEIDNTGQLNWHTDAAFAAVGSGGEFATVAQALMKHYVEGRDINVDDGLLIAYRAIESTCGVSSSFVGLPVWLATSTDKGARVLERTEIDKVGAEVEAWKILESETLLTLRAADQGSVGLIRFDGQVASVDYAA
jgi:20S proteasome alpha/beta subunit